MVNIAIPGDSNIRTKEHEKVEKHQGMKEELKRMWGVKVSVVSVVIGAHWAVTPKLGEWLQQIQRIPPEICPEEILGTIKILCRILRPKRT